jgi:acyl-CoA synthetase (AMP-forming)/AMP-acid ligase II
VGKPAETDEDVPHDSRRRRSFLRTGDVGFVRDHELFVTGRLKDLIIIRGRNVYPHDVESSVERSDPRIRKGCTAAFGVETTDGEGLVVAIELNAGNVPARSEIEDTIRRAVVADHDVRVHDVLVLPPGGVPKTSSGKLQRYACRRMYLDGDGTAFGAPPTEGGAQPIPVTTVFDWLRVKVAAELQIEPAAVSPRLRWFRLESTRSSLSVCSSTSSKSTA